MRLINVNTYVVHEFFGDAIPEYATLSHTWGEEEVTLQDLQNLDERVKAKLGFKKIEGVCRQAQRDQLMWAWVDTCCIDKRNNVELSEAINAMFRWYANSTVCYAFLVDVSDVGDISKSRWFGRGWTLQELLAPSRVAFFSEQWEFLGYKTDSQLQDLLVRASAIPRRALVSFNPHDWGVAQRMSWASRRGTTRVEDAAYCLLGLFDVNMPLLYGEGERAFIRLQEEIMRVSDDQSIFAWTDQDVIAESPCGFLARSPANFANSHRIDACYPVRPKKKGDSELDTTYAITNRGIRIKLTLLPTDPDEPTTFYALLGASYIGPAIIIRRVIGSEFVRVHADTLLTSSDMMKRNYGAPRWYTGFTKGLILRRAAPALRSLHTAHAGNTTTFVDYSQLAHAGIRFVEITPLEAKVTNTSIIYTDWKQYPITLWFDWSGIPFTLQIYSDGSFALRSKTPRSLFLSRLGSTKETKGTYKTILQGDGYDHMTVTARSSLESSAGGGKVHCIVLHGRAIRSLLGYREEIVLGAITGTVGLSALLRFLYYLYLRKGRPKRLRTLAWVSPPVLLLAYLKARARKPGQGQISDRKDYRGGQWSWKGF